MFEHMTAFDRSTTAESAAQTAGPRGPSPTDSPVAPIRALPPHSVISVDVVKHSLAVAVTRAFAPGDCLIWENMPEEFANFRKTSHAPDDPVSGAGKRVNGASGAGLTDVRDHVGLSTVLGLVLARKNRQQSHWVVGVLPASSMLAGLNHAAIEQLQSISSRLLLIVLDDGAANREPNADRPIPEAHRQFDSLDSRWLQDLGLPYHRITDPAGVEDWTVRLANLRATDRAAVIHVCLADDGPRSGASKAAQNATSIRQDTVPPAPAAVLSVEAVAEVLKSRIGQDQRTIPAVAREWAVRSSGMRNVPGMIPLDLHEGPHVITWCRGLAEGGCYPVLVVPASFIRRNLGELIDEICLPGLAVTIVSVPDSSDGTSRANGARTMSDLAILQLLPNTRVRTPDSTEELKRSMMEGSDGSGPLAIQIPSPLASKVGAVIHGAEDDTLSHATDRPRVTDIDLRRERELIRALEFSPALGKWVAEYSRVGERPEYLWKWCLRGVQLTTLPCVDGRLQAHVCDTKVLSIMLNVLLDDVADRMQDPSFLAELFKITLGGRPDESELTLEQREYAAFTQQVWDEYWARTREYPVFAVFEELLQYDLAQLFNAIRYSSLLNRNLSLLNVVEHDLYSPHTMMQMSFSTVDLMCSPKFPWQELGKLREAIWHAQCMGRIGNLVTTWQREIPSRDFTSGVFARAVSAGDLDVRKLATADLGSVESAVLQGAHEEHFLRQWDSHLASLKALRRRFQAFDLDDVIQGLKQLLVTEFGSRGWK